MSSPTKAHREAALELFGKLGCWGRDMTGQPVTLGHIDIDLCAQALSDLESTAYARGLADGAERELFALAEGWLKHAAAIRSDEGVVAAAEALEDCANELLSLAETRESKGTP